MAWIVFMRGTEYRNRLFHANTTLPSRFECWQVRSELNSRERRTTGRKIRSTSAREGETSPQVGNPNYGDPAAKGREEAQRICYLGDSIFVTFVFFRGHENSCVPHIRLDFIPPVR